ncbi:MAG: hypothetical protein HQK67_12770, partial [Desulfamplus sp.]|nr:hypothetical protein [Desulfamplus sp.]
EDFLNDKDFTFFPEELPNENGDAVCLEGEFIPILATAHGDDLIYEYDENC